MPAAESITKSALMEYEAILGSVDIQLEPPISLCMSLGSFSFNSAAASDWRSLLIFADSFLIWICSALAVLEYSWLFHNESCKWGRYHHGGLILWGCINWGLVIPRPPRCTGVNPFGYFHFDIAFDQRSCAKSSSKVFLALLSDRNVGSFNHFFGIFSTFFSNYQVGFQRVWVIAKIWSFLH